MIRIAKSLLLALFVSTVVLAFAGTNIRTNLSLHIEDARMELVRKEHLIRYRFRIPLRGRPAFDKLSERLADKGVPLGSPIFMRVFKAESELELWMKKDDRFVLFETYPICKWSGRLGPKLKEGDHQSPEGFYSVTRRQLNPKSRWHRSFNIGFPNGFDRSYRRTGSWIMVHGGCSSVGCYAVTNDAIDEIWKIVNAALDNGQKRYQVHTFPFRMTDRNMAIRSTDQWAGFWRNLKSGYDIFNQTRTPPEISHCNGHYVVRPGKPGNSGEQVLRKKCLPELAAN